MVLATEGSGQFAAAASYQSAVATRRLYDEGDNYEQTCNETGSGGQHIEQSD
jgi:hypothetical protein